MNGEPAVSRDSRIHYSNNGFVVFLFCLVWTIEVLTAVCWALICR